MLDEVLISNPARDKAWESWIKRKDVRMYMKSKSEFKFPLDGSYETWVTAWTKAWDAGFQEGYDINLEDVDPELEITQSDWVGLRALYILLAIDTSSSVSGEVIKIVEHYTNKYGPGKIINAMSMLSRDNAVRDTFSAPDVMWARQVEKAIDDSIVDTKTITKVDW